LSEWCNLTPAMRCHAVNTCNLATLQTVSFGGHRKGAQLSQGGTPPLLATP